MARDLDIPGSARLGGRCPRVVKVGHQTGKTSGAALCGVPQPREGWNPAWIVLDTRALPEGDRLSLAAEVGYSETSVSKRKIAPRPDPQPQVPGARGRRPKG